MLQAGSLCFWLHSDLKGYRDKAWRAGQPGQKESEISPLEDSLRVHHRPADPAALPQAQDQLWEGQNTFLKGTSGWEMS